MAACMTPYPTQITGAEFLAQRRFALLADEPRVGKTGAAIMAADAVFARRILVVTTASGREVWRRAWSDWSGLPRRVLSVIERKDARYTEGFDVVIASWSGVPVPVIRSALLARQWDILILDESHFAARFSSARCTAVYGVPLDDGVDLNADESLSSRAARVWCLSGTPAPHDLFNMYPMMRALCSDRLKADGAMPDVMTGEAFKKRYCIERMKRMRWGYVSVIIGGRNGEELRARLNGLFLRRTQKEVGIRSPIVEAFPLTLPMQGADAINAAYREEGLDQVVLEALDSGRIPQDAHLGTVLRLSGKIKAHAVANAAADDLEAGTDKLVIAYWHREVGDILETALKGFGVVRVDGSTSAAVRAKREGLFRDRSHCRVFLAQIAAAGEAIDLSAAATLMFSEIVFSPKAMKQMALRITNHTRKRQCFVRVCMVADSIDEAISRSLIRLWGPITELYGDVK